MKKPDLDTQLGRLFIAAKRKHQYIKYTSDLAEIIDKSRQVVGNWKSRGIPNDEIDKLADQFGCSFKWLKYGEGDIDDIDKKPENNPLGIDLNKLTLDDIDYLKTALSVPANKRSDAKKIINVFSEPDGKKKETK